MVRRPLRISRRLPIGADHATNQLAGAERRAPGSVAFQLTADQEAV